MTLGDNGIFNKAKYAKANYLVTVNEEQLKLAQISNQLHESIDGDRTIPSSTSDLQTYSTNEQLIGTWVDGKSIYRQVFNISEKIYASYGSINTFNKLLKQNVDSLIDVGGYFWLGGHKLNLESTRTDWNLTPMHYSSIYIDENDDLYFSVLYNTGHYSDNPLTGTVWVEYTYKNN